MHLSCKGLVSVKHYWQCLSAILSDHPRSTDNLDEQQAYVCSGQVWSGKLTDVQQYRNFMEQALTASPLRCMRALACNPIWGVRNA